MTRIDLSPQVAAFLRSLAPDPRKRLRTALRQLEREHGNVKPLAGPLRGFFRLRTGSIRVIFVRKGPDRIDCVYADYRDVVCQVFERIRKRDLLEGGEGTHE